MRSLSVVAYKEYKRLSDITPKTNGKQRKTLPEVYIKNDFVRVSRTPETPCLPLLCRRSEQIGKMQNLSKILTQLSAKN